jgi:hypothetical protein
MERFDSIEQKIDKLLEEGGVGASGTMTVQQLQSTLNSWKNEIQVDFKKTIEKCLAPVPARDGPGLENHCFAHNWGGQFRRLPNTFKFPQKLSMFAAIQLWFCGNTTKKWSPLSLCNPSDVPKTGRNKVYFSKLRRVMGFIILNVENPPVVGCPARSSPESLMTVLESAMTKLPVKLAVSASFHSVYRIISREDQKSKTRKDSLRSSSKKKKTKKPKKGAEGRTDRGRRGERRSSMKVKR